jgi:hypothetical protein
MTVLKYPTPALEQTGIAEGEANGELAGWTYGQWLVEADQGADQATLADFVDAIWSGNFNDFNYAFGPQPPVAHG